LGEDSRLAECKLVLDQARCETQRQVLSVNCLQGACVFQLLSVFDMVDTALGPAGEEKSSHSLVHSESSTLIHK
jgi:hypothetical protein